MDHEPQQQPVTPACADRRDGPRVSYRDCGRIVLLLAEPDSELQALYRIKPVDLGETGMRFLHRAAIRAGLGAIVVLESIGGASIVTPGRIVRCAEVEPRVHEVGMAFDRPIRLEEFVRHAA